MGCSMYMRAGMCGRWGTPSRRLAKYAHGTIAGPWRCAREGPATARRARLTRCNSPALRTRRRPVRPGRAPTARQPASIENPIAPDHRSVGFLELEAGELRLAPDRSGGGMAGDGTDLGEGVARALRLTDEGRWGAASACPLPGLCPEAMRGVATRREGAIRSGGCRLQGVSVCRPGCLPKDKACPDPRVVQHVDTPLR